MAALTKTVPCRSRVFIHILKECYIQFVILWWIHAFTNCPKLMAVAIGWQYIGTTKIADDVRPEMSITGDSSATIVSQMQKNRQCSVMNHSPFYQGYCRLTDGASIAHGLKDFDFWNSSVCCSRCFVKYLSSYAATGWQSHSTYICHPVI